MTTPRFAQRFRVAAAVAGAVAVLVGAAIVVVMIVVVPRGDATGDAILVGVALAICLAIAGVSVQSVRRARALARVGAAHPDGLVFMARRQPSLVSDLAVYLRARDIDADVADRWLVALVDDRGVSVWGIGSAPAELLLMPWSELGAIEVTDLESGGRGRGIAVDVRPFDTPLIVAIGYSAFGLTATLGREGVAEVAALAEERRPGS
ncbi:MAG: hypothetical protein ABIQ01_02700 [Pseudolysinimonas sp.]